MKNKVTRNHELRTRKYNYQLPPPPPPNPPPENPPPDDPPLPVPLPRGAEYIAVERFDMAELKDLLKLRGLKVLIPAGETYHSGCC
jgi:hypothetical protein